MISVPDADFRGLLQERDPQLTPSQLDFLFGFLEKSSEGNIIIRKMPPPPPPPLPQPLDPQHHAHVCRRLVTKLAAASTPKSAMNMVKLVAIMAAFWHPHEWAKCLSSYLPLFLSDEEARNLVVHMIESRQPPETWAADVQGIGRRL